MFYVKNLASIKVYEFDGAVFKFVAFYLYSEFKRVNKENI